MQYHSKGNNNVHTIKNQLKKYTKKTLGKELSKNTLITLKTHILRLKKNENRAEGG